MDAVVPPVIGSHPICVYTDVLVFSTTMISSEQQRYDSQRFDVSLLDVESLPGRQVLQPLAWLLRYVHCLSDHC